MADWCNIYDEPGDLRTGGQREDTNEVVIVIRDGDVVTFIQRKRNTVVEGQYGDGI